MPKRKNSPTEREAQGLEGLPGGARGRKDCGAGAETVFFRQ
jgi:hypothetical protein